MPAHLVGLDLGRVRQREAAHAGPERDQGERLRPELLGLPQRRRRRAADDVGRRRAAELHRRGVDDPPRRHLPRGRLDRLAEADRRAPGAAPPAARGPIGARRWLSRGTPGPPAREIAPAPPPPWASRVFAALAIASTARVVMSVSRTSTVAAMPGGEPTRLRPARPC